jgi:hypothetical protein
MGLDPLSSIPLVGGFFDHSDDAAMDTLKNSRDIYGNIKLPEFQDYKPEDLKYLGDYSPELMRAEMIKEDPQLRSNQLGYLAKLSGLADTGLSQVDQQGYERARELGGQMAHSGSEAAMQNAAARGIAGSGMEFANREIANQEGANRAQQAGLAQASDSARNRMLYEQAYGQGLSGLRGQDFGVNSANTGILNQFNMANTNNQNQANLRNIDTRQGLSNQNVGQHNFAQQYNNNLKQMSFGDAMSRAGGMAGANQNIANGYYAQNAANTAQRNQYTNMLGQAVGWMGSLGGKSGGGAGQNATGGTPLSDSDISQYASMAAMA